MKLISACLLGIRCTWDGKDNYKSDKAIKLLNSETGPASALLQLIAADKLY